MVLVLTGTLYSMDVEEFKRKTPGEKFDALVVHTKKGDPEAKSSCTRFIFAARDSFETISSSEGEFSFNLTKLYNEVAAQIGQRPPDNKKYAVLAGAAVGGYFVLRGAEWVIRKK